MNCIIGMCLHPLAGFSEAISSAYRRTAFRWGAASLSLLMLAVLGLTPGRAHASLPIWHDQQQLTSIAAAPNGGFWVQVDNRGGNGITSVTLPKQCAPVFENVLHRGNIAAIPGRNGYWVVRADGTLYARDDAPSRCGGQLSNCSGFHPVLSEIIVGAAETNQRGASCVAWPT